MHTILITAGLFLLILISLFLILVILMQRANANAGLGAAFGGGVTESAFGTDAGNIMARATKYTAGAFFALCLGLYLVILSSYTQSEVEEGLPTFETPAAAAADAEMIEASSEITAGNEVRPSDTVGITVDEGLPVPATENTQPAQSE